MHWQGNAFQLRQRCFLPRPRLHLRLHPRLLQSSTPCWNPFPSESVLLPAALPAFEPCIVSDLQCT